MGNFGQEIIQGILFEIFSMGSHIVNIWNPDQDIQHIGPDMEHKFHCLDGKLHINIWNPY